MHTFEKPVNVIQASISLNRKFLGYVTKESGENELVQFVYKPYLINLNENAQTQDVLDLKLERSHQIMVQFLYRKQSVLSENQPDKLLVLIHRESKCDNIFHLISASVYVSCFLE